MSPSARRRTRRERPDRHGRAARIAGGNARRRRRLPGREIAYRLGGGTANYETSAAALLADCTR
jgi:hypothetical protein